MLGDVLVVNLRQIDSHYVDVLVVICRRRLLQHHGQHQTQNQAHLRKAQIITSRPAGLTISSRKGIKKGKSKELKFLFAFSSSHSSDALLSRRSYERDVYDFTDRGKRSHRRGRLNVP